MCQNDCLRNKVKKCKWQSSGTKNEGLVCGHIEPCEDDRRGGGIEGLYIGRLSHVDLFTKITMKEGILDIKLVDKPITRDFNTKNSMTGGRIDKWNK